MTDQTVTLRITSDARGLVAGVQVVKQELNQVGATATQTGNVAAAGMARGEAAAARFGSVLDRVRGFALGAVAAFVGFNSIPGILNAAVGGTVAQERALAQVEARIKSTGGAAGLTAPQLAGMASGLQNITTYADDAVSEMQALLLTFTKVGGDTFVRAQKSILNVATAMQTDLKSAAIQVGKALNDPAEGLTALSRSGIQFSKAQEEMIKRLTETGQVAQAQAIILDELETQFGGAAEAARNTLGGALDALKISFGDLFEVTDDLPQLREAIESATAALKDPATVQTFQQLASTIISAIPVIVNGFVTIAKHAGEVTAAVAIFAGVRGLGAIVTAATAAGGALATLRVAGIALMGVMGGLPGLLAAVAAGVFALGTYMRSTDTDGMRLAATLERLEQLRNGGQPTDPKIWTEQVKVQLEALKKLEEQAAKLQGSFGAYAAQKAKQTADAIAIVRGNLALLQESGSKDLSAIGEKFAAAFGRVRVAATDTDALTSATSRLVSIGVAAGTVQARQAKAVEEHTKRMEELAQLEKDFPARAGEIQRTRLQIVAAHQKEIASITGVAAANRAGETQQRRAQKADEERVLSMRKLVETTLRVTSAANPSTAAWNEYSESVRRFADAGARAIEAGNNMADVQNNVSQQTDAAAAALERSLVAIQREAEERRRAADVVGLTLAGLELEARQIGMTARERTIHNLTLEAEARARDAVAAGVNRSVELTEAERAAIVQRANAAMDSIDATEASERSLESLRQVGLNVFTDLADATTDWAMRGFKDFKGFMDGVKDAFKRMLADILNQLINSGLRNALGSLFGMSGNGGGFNLGSLFGGGSGSAGMPNLGLMQFAPYAGALAGGAYGFQNRGGSNGSGGSVAAGVAYGTAGYALGSVALGAYAGGAGAAAMGAGAVGAGALGGASMAAAAIPVVGWIIAAMALIDAVSGGKLFGTRYRAESLTSSINLSELGGGEAETSIREVRNRSLFRGRQWRTRDVESSDEAVEAAGQLFASVREVMTASARQLRGEVPPMIDAALRTVVEYDSKGKVKATKYFVDLLGRTWEEASAELAVTRINAEAIIASIDSVLGTTADAAGAAIADTVTDAFDAAGNQIGNAGSRVTDHVDNIVKNLGGTAGEASTIAERWRENAEELMAGAQFLLAAATDIRAGAGLLGETGTLTQITALIEDLQKPGEELIETYGRVSASTRLLEDALGLSGVVIDQTREGFVRLATEITEAAGGLERAQQLWSNYFQRFYSDEERRALALTRAQANAASQFGDIGLGAGDFQGSDAIARFRALFDAALPTLSAEAIVQWLEAADALGAVIDLQGTYNEVLETTVSGLADIMAAVDEQLSSFAPPQTFAERISAINAGIDELIRKATNLGASEAELARIRELGVRRVGVVLAEQAQAMGEYSAFVAGFRPDQDAGLSEFQRSIRAIGRETNTAVDRANELARAAGLAGAASQDLAEIQMRGAERVAAAAAALEASIASLRDQLYEAAEDVQGSALGPGALQTAHWLAEQSRLTARAPAIDPERFALAARLASQARELSEFAGNTVLETLARLRVPLDRLVADFGVDIARMDSPEVFDRFVEASRTLGTDVLDAARALGLNVGALADTSSQLNDAFERAMGRLPANVQRALDPLFRAYESATTPEGRATARTALVDAIDDLPPQLRALLAPFLEEINVTALAEQQLGAAEQTNRYLSSSVEHLAEIQRLLTIANGPTRQTFGPVTKLPPPPPPAAPTVKTTTEDTRIAQEVLRELQRLNYRVDNFELTLSRLADRLAVGMNGAGVTT